MFVPIGPARRGLDVGSDRQWVSLRSTLEKVVVIWASATFRLANGIVIHFATYPNQKLIFCSSENDNCIFNRTLISRTITN